VFYVNASTGQSQWQPPTGPVLAYEAAGVAVGAAEAEAQAAAEAAAEVEAAAKRKADEDAAAAADAVAKKRLEDEDAVAAADAAAKKKLEDRVVVAAAAVITQQAAAADTSLPPGWLAQIDSTSGRVFYAHSSTGRTQWEPPVSNAPHSTERTPEHTPRPEASSEAQPSELEARLPDGWEERVDPSTGCPFYVQLVTGASQWERPKVESAGTGGTLPPGWQAKFDPTGRIFYVNLESGATQWGRPSPSMRPSSVNSNASC
jgi:hypothetical protein